MPSYDQPPLFEMATEPPFMIDLDVIAREAQARYERQNASAPVEPQPQAIGQAERLHIMHDVSQFYPTNGSELSLAFAIKDIKDSPAGVAGYLNEILLHQMKTPKAEVPARALLSIVSEMAGYASKARADKTALQTMREELAANRDSSPLQSLKQAGVATGLGQYVRQLDLRQVAQTGDSSKLPFNPLRGSGASKRTAFDPYTASQPTPEVRQRIDQVTGTARLWQAREIINELVDEQSQRFTFWAENINDARRHAAARAAAYSALKQLGMTPPKNG